MMRPMSRLQRHVRITRRVGVLLVVAVFVACNAQPSSTTRRNGEISLEHLAGVAVGAFSDKFDAYIQAPEQIVIPAELDGAIVAQHLKVEIPVVNETPTDEAYWKVIGITDHGTYWEVRIESASGVEYFRGPIFLQLEGENIRVAEPEDLGVTATTATS